MQRPGAVRSTMRAIDECECLDCKCEYLACQTKQCLRTHSHLRRLNEVLDSSLCRVSSKLLHKDGLFI